MTTACTLKPSQSLLNCQDRLTEYVSSLNVYPESGMVNKNLHKFDKKPPIRGSHVTRDEGNTKDSVSQVRSKDHLETKIGLV